MSFRICNIDVLQLFQTDTCCNSISDVHTVECSYKNMSSVVTQSSVVTSQLVVNSNDNYDAISMWYVLSNCQAVLRIMLLLVTQVSISTCEAVFVI